jgi:hypothetical protein
MAIASAGWTAPEPTGAKRDRKVGRQGKGPEHDEGRVDVPKNA